MSLSASESSLVELPGCEMSAPRVNGVTGIEVGPVSVEFAGVFQSTWNFQKFRFEVVASSRTKVGEPAGCIILPSMSAARRLAEFGGSKHWPFPGFALLSI